MSRVAGPKTRRTGCRARAWLRKAASGGTDTIARALAEVVGKGAGVPVIVDNRPGAFAQIATNQVAQAPADGYTLLLVAAGHTLTSSPPSR